MRHGPGPVSRFRKDAASSGCCGLATFVLDSGGRIVEGIVLAGENPDHFLPA